MTEILDIMIFISSLLAGIILGLLIGRIFVKITKNKKFCLTNAGTIVFGKKTGFKSQFISGPKGTLIVILDLFIIALITTIIENIVSKVILTHPIFYFPFTIFILTGIYNIIRKTTKISAKEWIVLSIIYLACILSTYALFRI